MDTNQDLYVEDMIKVMVPDEDIPVLQRLVHEVLNCYRENECSRNNLCAYLQDYLPGMTVIITTEFPTTGVCVRDSIVVTQVSYVARYWGQYVP